MSKQSGYFIKAKVWVSADTTDPMSMGVATDKTRMLTELLAKGGYRVLEYSAIFQMRREIEEEPAPALGPLGGAGATQEQAPPASVSGETKPAHPLDVPPALKRTPNK